MGQGKRTLAARKACDYIANLGELDEGEANPITFQLSISIISSGKQSGRNQREHA